MQISRAPPPPPPLDTSRCSSCGAKYRGEDLLRNEVLRLKEKLQDRGKAGLISQFYEISEANDNEIAIQVAIPQIPRLPDENSTQEEKDAFLLLELELILLLQTHKWKHVSSCFKKSSNAKRGDCRYCFPRNVCV